ncbi:uncharacterized protein LOC105697543 [Orussus abietinus]|uniref:uncharacterized protein LOC105697543 n=1 Tax=Orussus abietinus TaxID=222816 RepID=UPI000626D576|nr:uncharacterized protein LOC105697543 [Orussus abietinus]
MGRHAKWKLAVVAGISQCLVYAEAKYCALEIHGEPRYYACPKNEYCCNFGCCVSPGFQIYHLWYYWLLVIIMFLVCSGGGWWYRYWLQGRYRAAASAIPSRSSNSRTQNPLRGPTCQAQQARITYNSARNTVLLHRMWKGPHRNMASSGYNGAASSSAHFQNTSVVLNDSNCPYYQLYGPPPSYETVIAQTRGKIPSPTSPEGSRSPLSHASGRAQTLPPCFNHAYPPTRLNGVLMDGLRLGSVPGISRMPPLDSRDAAWFPNVPRRCAGFAMRLPTVCRGDDVTRNAFKLYHTINTFETFNVDRPLDPSEVENVPRSDESSPERYTILSIDCASGSGQEPSESSPGTEIPRVHTKPELDKVVPEEADSGRRRGSQVTEVSRKCENQEASSSLKSGPGNPRGSTRKSSRNAEGGNLKERSNSRSLLDSRDHKKGSQVEGRRGEDLWKRRFLENEPIGSSIDPKGMASEGEKRLVRAGLWKPRLPEEPQPVGGSRFARGGSQTGSGLGFGRQMGGNFSRPLPPGEEKADTSPGESISTAARLSPDDTRAMSQCAASSPGGAASPSRLNPSNNVILAPLTSNVEATRQGRNSPLPARGTNLSLTFESKQRLDRSKSLD